MGSVLSFGVDDSGALAIVPRRARRSVWLKLLPDGPEVCGPDSKSVLFPWDAFLRLRWEDAPAVADYWSLKWWYLSRGGVYGLAVHAGGTFDDRLVQALGKSVSRRSGRLNPWTSTGHAVPIMRVGRVRAHRETLEILCELLSKRSELRMRLGDRSRVTQLAADLADRSVLAPIDRTGRRRDEIEIIVAMRQSGLVYPFGRPLGDEHSHDIEAMVRMVQERLDASPYRKDRRTDQHTITRVLRRDYVDVTPWPLAALVA
jgi:hypothetical protein